MRRGRDSARPLPRWDAVAVSLVAARPLGRPLHYADNVAFRDFAAEINLPVDYSEGPGGHEWGYWDARIQDILAWLPLKE